CQQSYTLPLTF
nr:immunoglobulin light chain junction region [Macaca mulatta]MOX48242.1 immunoglobulin light chain junction region [Macaca mulatta]MOX48250.1 immunoglobulin light chain junction region [Macaca mulatta]MOX49304.1 immunoglobulin light chain junction region [Macaca mulatta]MOX49515.1 immunoglobulin light chain junction region [Macaca mulatta]